MRGGRRCTLEGRERDSSTDDPPRTGGDGRLTEPPPDYRVVKYSESAANRIVLERLPGTEDSSTVTPQGQSTSKDRDVSLELLLSGRRPSAN